MESRYFVGRDDEGHRYFVLVRLGPDELNDLSRFYSVEHDYVSRDEPVLSMTYEQIDKRGGVQGCGAGVADLHKYVTKPASAQLLRMGQIAERWHLNGMRAGCAHQKVAYETDRYGRRIPSLRLTLPCPVTGYKYGTAWLVEPLPREVVEEIRSWT